MFKMFDVDHLAVNFGKALFAVHVPAQHLKKRIDIIHAGMVFVVAAVFILLHMLAKPFDEHGGQLLCLFSG